MSALAVRVFSSHPFARLLYANILGSEEDLQVVEDSDTFSVGIFDGLLADVEGLLNLTRLKSPSMRPLMVSNTRDENECLRWIFRGVWGLVPYEDCQQQLAQAVHQV